MKIHITNVSRDLVAGFWIGGILSKLYSLYVTAFVFCEHIPKCLD